MSEDTVTLYPNMIWEIDKTQRGAYRCWVLLLDELGPSKIPLREFVERTISVLGYSQRSAYHIRQQGESMFWETCDGILKLLSPKEVAKRIHRCADDMAKTAEIPREALLDKHRWRAELYKVALHWHLSYTKRNLIKRETIENLSGISKRQQVEYDKLAQIPKFAAYSIEFISSSAEKALNVIRYLKSKHKKRLFCKVYELRYDDFYEAFVVLKNIGNVYFADPASIEYQGNFVKDHRRLLIATQLCKKPHAFFRESPFTGGIIPACVSRSNLSLDHEGNESERSSSENKHLDQNASYKTRLRQEIKFLTGLHSTKLDQDLEVKSETKLSSAKLNQNLEIKSKTKLSSTKLDQDLEIKPIDKLDISPGKLCFSSDNRLEYSKRSNSFDSECDPEFLDWLDREQKSRVEKFLLDREDAYELGFESYPGLNKEYIEAKLRKQREESRVAAKMFRELFRMNLDYDELMKRLEEIRRVAVKEKDEKVEFFVEKCLKSGLLYDICCCTDSS